MNFIGTNIVVSFLILWFFVTRAASGLDVEDLWKLPKCCSYKQSLAHNNQSYYCVEDDHRITFFEPMTPSFPKDCTKNEYCIDQLHSIGTRKEFVKLKCNRFQDETPEYIRPTFHKCCPLGKVYNETDHKCVSSSKIVSEELIGDVSKQYVLYGLPNCDTVIEDLFVKNLTEIKYNLDKSARVLGELASFDNYCLDETDSDKFVVRVCKSDGDCKRSESDSGINCYAKCCPDGYSFVHGTKCLPSFDSGVDRHSSRVKKFPGKNSNSKLKNKLVCL